MNPVDGQEAGVLLLKIDWLLTEGPRCVSGEPFLNAT